MMRRFIDFSTVLMIVCCWLFAGAIAYWTTDYFRPPIQVIDSSVTLDLQHDRMMLGTTFIWYRHCDGTLRGWIRSTAPEPPPRDWTALTTIPLPPKGFSGQIPQPGVELTKWVSIPLNGYVPKGTGVLMAQREFACNPLQHLFPITVSSPLTRFDANVPD